MRISTSMQYSNHLAYLQKANTNVDKASQSYNTGLKFQTAGENPGGMAASIKYQSDIVAYKQYSTNASIVADNLSQEETALGQIWDSLGSIKTRLIQSVNGTLDDGSRAALAEDIKQTQAQLFDLMNTKNSEGEYIFSGAQSKVPTYQLQSDGTYICQADGSNKFVNVSPTIRVQTTDSGLNIFENVRLADDFTTTNSTITGLVSGLSDYDQFSSFFKDNYQYGSAGQDAQAPANTGYIKVQDDGTWSLYVGVADPAPQGTQPAATGFVKDGKIEVEGMSFAFPDENYTLPAGQTQTISFSLDKPQTDNILNQLTDMIDNLLMPKDEYAANGYSNDQLVRDLSKMQENVNLAMKQVDTYRGEVGARGSNIDAIIKSNETLGDAKSEAKANVTEIDAFEAVSNMVMAQNALQVAQQSYNLVHSSTLFDYM